LLAANPRRTPTLEEVRQSVEILLATIEAARDILDALDEIRPFHPKNNTFPGEVFMRLAADALYDAASQLASVTDFNGNTSGVTNTADGLPSSLTLGGSGDTVATTYDPTDALSAITLSNGSTLQSFSYSDAPSGAIASETDTPSSSLTPAA
jgi:hypothetical protein